jgi:hypothetical protein
VGAGIIGALLFKEVGGVIGLLVGLGTAKVTIDGFRTEHQRKRALLVPGLPLAQRYQDDPATYNQAAACYLAWLAKTPHLPAPIDEKQVKVFYGLIAFLANYRCYANAHADQRTALFNAVIAQVCGHTTSEDIAWAGKLMQAVYTGSDEQKLFLKSFLSAQVASGAHRIYVQPWEQLISGLYVRRTNELGGHAGV